MRRCFFTIQTSNIFFLLYLNPIILQFFTFLQDKIALIQSVQDDRNTRFFCTTNYRTDHIIKRFHEGNSIMQGLSQKNMPLCDMQGYKFGLLVKTIKFPKSPIRQAGRVLTLTSTKFPVTAVNVWVNINRVTLQHDREFIMCRFYFPLFMVLLCVIFKSVWYLRAAFWVPLHAMPMCDWKQAAQRLKKTKKNKNITIRWNMYKDNNFREPCLWKSWISL